MRSFVILVREALHKSHEDEKAYHDGRISSLQARYTQTFPNKALELTL